jgi:hypothetical protein
LPKQKPKRKKPAAPARPEIPLTEKCHTQIEKMDASDAWCGLDIRDKRSYVQCKAKQLRSKDPKMSFGDSMKAAWDIYRKACKPEAK